ncbi:hypothetical protein BJ170DRAFT_680428 [Xylariales sp. AK1849]|nr:hypothetical protein BJ170DRAFT_680428 [Xylariales sp. AK1849]
MGSRKRSDIPLKCEFKIPGPDDSTRTYLDRWSDTNVELPALIVVPKTERDIVDSICYAKENKLQIVAACGKHGSFVPITNKTLYLDLKRFNALAIDHEAETVTLGGGIVTGDVLRRLAEDGFYTCLPNGNEVGVVGAFLGGGGGNFNGVKGFLVDHVVSIKITTADGNTRILTSSSPGEELALFNTLRGAGHGLGIIVELVVKIYRVAHLNMTDNKAWVRRTIFPPSAIDVAAAAYESLQPVRGPIQAVLLFARAPPGTPGAGSPVIALLATYFGPVDEAEKALAPLLGPEVTEKAIVKATAMVDLKDSNNAAEAMNAHGGYKVVDSAFLNKIGAETITDAFARFVALGESHEDTYPTTWVAGAWDPSVAVRYGQMDAAKGGFFEPRGRGVCVYQYAWYTDRSSEDAAKEYVKEATDIVMRREEGVMRRFANNLRFPAELGETYGQEKVREIMRVKGTWDPEGVFWSPGTK